MVLSTLFVLFTCLCFVIFNIFVDFLELLGRNVWSNGVIILVLFILFYFFFNLGQIVIEF